MTAQMLLAFIHETSVYTDVSKQLPSLQSCVRVLTHLYADWITAVVLYGHGERRAPERGSVRHDRAGLRVQALDFLHVGPHQTEQTTQAATLRTAGGQ